MALERVVGDDGFDIDSSLAIEAHQCAVSLLRFVSAEANAQPASKFAEKLISSLNSSCFSKSKSIRVQRDHLCEKSFQLRSSKEYREMWSKYLGQSIECRACPIFFQAVTDNLIKQLVKNHYAVSHADAATSLPPLDNIELKVVRYAAGYVLHSLKKKINRSAHRNKKEILIRISELEEVAGIAKLKVLYMHYQSNTCR